MKERNRVAPERADLEAQVAAHPFLIGMSEHHIRLLTDCAMRSHFEAGHFIFREGETANRFYLIEHGKIALESSTLGEPVRIDEIHDGDLLGWSWLFPPYAWHFTARHRKRPPPFSFTGRSCDNTARKITLSALSCLNELALSCCGDYKRLARS
jgi:hypothetical protein